MPLTNFNASKKTEVPACCSFGCCGNHFGRILGGKGDRLRKVRRYAKHAERQQVRHEIRQQLQEEHDLIQDEINEMKQMFADDADDAFSFDWDNRRQCPDSDPYYDYDWVMDDWGLL